MAARTVTCGPDRSVCVVITTYNHAHFLADALDSVLAQSIPASQILVVDDGSLDNPAEVVARYPGVQLIRQDNAGLAAARNAGLGHTQCDLVIFLDADDVLTANAVQSGLECYAAHPLSGFVYGAYRLVDQNLVPTSGPQFRPLGSSATRDLLVENLIGMHAAVLYDREKLIACGGFDETLLRCEDYDAYFRLARKHPAACHPEVAAHYRIHQGNMSSDPVEMLEWALAVHARYQPPADDREGQAAWRAGRSFLKASYANDAWKDRPERNGIQKRTQRARMMRITPISSIAAAIWQTARRILPRPLAKLIKQVLLRARGPGVGSVDLGALNRTSPISRQFGFDRGTPIDRHYIGDFLARNQHHITGRVLEIGDAAYSAQFGRDITVQDILHLCEGDPPVTLVGDMSQAGVLPENTFDCMIITQTLHLIYDMEQAVRNMRQALQVGGSLLLSVPGISRVGDGEWDEGWYWSLTRQSAWRMFGEIFGPENIEVTTYGNVYAATAFLHGLAAEEVKPDWLGRHDPAYPVIVAVRARRAD